MFQNHRLRLRLDFCLMLLAMTAVFTATRADADQAMATAPARVYIIRHAEKPAESTDGKKNPDLAPRGFERAKALATTFVQHFSKPDFIIATHATSGSNRPAETVTPLAKALRLDIDTEWKAADVDTVAHSILTDPKYAGKTVLIAWHHKEIPDLAKAFGVHQVPKQWGDDTFDRVWEITFDHQTATMRDLPEQAMEGDSKDEK